MNYGKLVEKNRQQFGAKGFLKFAADLAAILDNPLFKINLTSDRYENQRIVEPRAFTLEVFNKLCRECSIPEAAYEKELFKVFLPQPPKDESGKKKEAKRKETQKKIVSALKGIHSKKATLARAVAEIMSIFRDCGYGDIKEESLMAIINETLDSFTIPPIRPDFSDIALSGYPHYETGPEKEVLIVIFDDSKEELLKTGRRLAGWPNLNFSFVYYKSDWFPSSDTEKKEMELKKAAKTIMAQSPDIVLMDQGLGSINGHEVVLKIKELYEKFPIFIANTGGTPDELRSAGCLYENCNKGETLSPIKTAIARLARG